MRDLQERRGNVLRQALAIVHSALRQADADARRATGLLKQGVLVASPHADQQWWDEQVGICALSEWPLALESEEIRLARDAGLSAELVAELSACLRTGRGREWIRCGGTALLAMRLVEQSRAPGEWQCQWLPPLQLPLKPESEASVASSSFRRARISRSRSGSNLQRSPSHSGRNKQKDGSGRERERELLSGKSFGGPRSCGSSTSSTQLERHYEEAAQQDAAPAVMARAAVVLDDFVPPADEMGGIKYVAFERQEQVLLLGTPTPNGWIECVIQRLNRRGWAPFNFFRLL